MPLLSGVDAARRYANAHTGHELVSYREVALPLFRVECEMLVLEQKDLPPIAEFVLRTVDKGLDHLEAVAGFLGLAEELVTDAAADLLRRGDLMLVGGADGPEHRLALTEKGRQTAEQAAAVQAVEMPVPVFVDGLTREVVSVNARAIGAFPARRAGDRGLTEIAAYPRKRPGNEDIPFEMIRDAIAKEARGRRAQREVIGVVGLRGTKRYARPGVALAYRSLEDGELLISLIVDGQPSEPHDAAFARAADRSARRLVPETWTSADEALADDLPHEVRRAAAPTTETAPLLAEQAEAQRQRDSLREEADNAGPADVEALRRQLDEAEQRARQLQEALDNISVRHVEVYEHPGYLDRALQEAQKRVMIIAPWVRHEVVDAPFVQRLRGLLDRGVELWIGYGISADETYRKGRRGEADRDAERALETLAGDFENFRLTRLGDTHAKVLVCDSRFSILTSFNWLSFRGASDLHFRDERGFYVGLHPQVDTLFDSYAERFPAHRGAVNPAGSATTQND
ncbi:MAG: hypothetical protein M3340_01020 [Actinomycetota bacterium]|nr:hypothetical protein [Actinomycetota bacterium]